MLSDTAASRWTSDELLEYVRAALDEYSQYFPFVTAVTPTGADGVYTMDPEWTVTGVSHLDASDYEQFLEELRLLPGRGLSQSSRGWWRVGDTLYVRPTTLDSVAVYLTTRHTIPTSDASVLTVPSTDEQMIVDFICGMAVERFSIKTALLDRWREKGKRDDNPVEVPRSVFRKNFERAILARLSKATLRKYTSGRDRPRGEA